MSATTLTIAREVYNDETGELIDEIDITVDVSYTNGRAESMDDPGELSECSVDGAYLYDKNVRTPVELTDEEADSIPERLEEHLIEQRAAAAEHAYDCWKDERHTND